LRSCKNHCFKKCRWIKIGAGFFGRMVLISMVILSGVSAHASPLSEPETDLLPDVFVPFDPENGPEYVLVVEKETQSLFLYEIASAPKKIYQWICSTGKQIGAKTRSGDGKTPEGIYFFNRVYQDRELSPIYGVRAFPIDYPNLLDRAAERTGSAIWLHGTNKPLKARDSNGCIVLENTDLEAVEKYIALNRTPIVIVDKLNFEAFEPKTALKKAILEMVDQWIEAVDHGTYQDYVRLYDPEYVPEIAWWSDWYKVRKRLKEAESESELKVRARNIAIYKHQSVMVALFDPYLEFGDHEIPVGTKKLYLSDKGEGLRIIGDTYQTLPDAVSGPGEDNPLVLAAQDLRVRGADEAEIEQMVDEWLKAWSSMDIEEYGSFYAGDFRSQGMDKAGWLDYKKRLNRKYDYIRVTQKNLQTEQSEDQTRVTFVQNYESSGFKASGMKTLLLKREDGEWKIYRETWSKM
jgi:murein L,D-transpeptidase YafK